MRPCPTSSRCSFFLGRGCLSPFDLITVRPANSLEKKNTNKSSRDRSTSILYFHSFHNHLFLPPIPIPNLSYCLYPYPLIPFLSYSSLDLRDPLTICPISVPLALRKSQLTLKAKMSPLPPNVHVSTHPLLHAKLSLLRSRDTDSRETKRLVNDIATILGVEALAGLAERDDGTVSYPNFCLCIFGCA